ncbi:MAG: hypothetical protein RI580_08875 [Halothece sp. Uz-M2-17]|nr:hypothetical protein [Halothece sp. Uz-M2-17]
MKRLFSLGLLTGLILFSPFAFRQAGLAQELPEPAVNIDLPDELITIQLINQTSDAVQYQIVGDTQLRSLLGQSDVTLSSLRVPIALIFHYSSIPRSFPDQTGLIQAELTQDDQTGDLKVTLKPTTDPALDSSSIEIDIQGDVYIF